MHELRLLMFRPSVLALIGLLAVIAMVAAECDDFSTYPKK